MAAAYAADKKGPVPQGPIPPPQLIKAWQCHRWGGGKLNPGGLRNQPVKLMREMTACENVYDAVTAWRRSKNWAQFQKDNPKTWTIVGEVLKRRKNAR